MVLEDLPLLSIIDLHDWVILVVNVGKYSSTMAYGYKSLVILYMLAILGKPRCNDAPRLSGEACQHLSDL